LVAKLSATDEDDALLVANWSLAACDAAELVANWSLAPCDAAELVANWSLAFCADALLVPKVSVVEVLAARVLLEDRFRLAFREAALLFAPALLLEELEVPFAAIAPPEAVVLLAAVPVPPELLPPPAEVLLEVELPNVFALPFLPAAAKFSVEPEVAVLLCEAALFSEAPRVAAAVWVLPAVMAPLVAKAFVVPLDLLEASAALFVVALLRAEFSAALFVVALLRAEFSAALFVVALFFAWFAANAFVVALERLALFEAEADSVSDACDWPPDCCARLLVELMVVESLCDLALLSVNDEVSVVEWFSEVLRLCEAVSVRLSLELLLTVSWLFAPRW
jgi:hypothetical protein